MSDVHCPARLLLVAPQPADALVAALRFERVAGVCAGPGPGPLETARAVAAAFGLPVRTLAEDAGPPPGRLGEDLQEVVDAHRGETVLVVADPETLACAVPVRLPGTGEPLLAEVDADGWRVTRYPGLDRTGRSGAPDEATSAEGVR